MKKQILLSLFILSGLMSHGQIIKGRVLDNSTRQAVTAAYIYFNGTMAVAMSDANGNFEMNISKYKDMPLTISAIGYNSVTLANPAQENPLTVLLTPKSYNLAEVKVVAKSKNRKRAKYIKLFKEEFLGLDYKSKGCEIENEEDITFNYKSDKEVLKAIAMNPIRIFNRRLGYRVTFHLDVFNHTWKTRETAYGGNFLFADLASTTDSTRKLKYDKERFETYQGSRLHFFRALWADSLEQKYFIITTKDRKQLFYNDVVTTEGGKKYFFYPEEIHIGRKIGPDYYYYSPISFCSDKVYFNPKGYFEGSGIRWTGIMGNQRIADFLPYEYVGVDPDFRDGIKFVNGSWAEVMEEARQTSKPVFVSLYTPGNAVAEKMYKEVLMRRDAGQFYNKNFICCHIDAGKGEGVEIAKKYNVKKAPTYLYIKPDGELCYIINTDMDAQKFIVETVKALENLNDPRPLSVLEKEYAEKKNDPDFLLTYMKKRTLIRKSNAALLEEYLALQPAEKRITNEIIQLYKREWESFGCLNMDVNTLTFKSLSEHRASINPTGRNDVDRLIYEAIEYTFQKAGKSKDERLFKQALAEYGKLPSIYKRNHYEERYCMGYYQQAGDTEKYIRYATDYCQMALMPVSPDSIAELDKKPLEEMDQRSHFYFMKRIKNENLTGKDSILFQQEMAKSAHRQGDYYCFVLNSIAWSFFKQATDVRALKNALRWSKRSLEFRPYNQSCLDTYANLLYKSGKTKKAIEIEKEALRIAGIARADTRKYEEAIRKMSAGEKTWE